MKTSGGDTAVTYHWEVVKFYVLKDIQSYRQTEKVKIEEPLSYDTDDMHAGIS